MFLYVLFVANLAPPDAPVADAPDMKLLLAVAAEDRRKNVSSYNTLVQSLHTAALLSLTRLLHTFVCIRLSIGDVCSH